MIGWFDNPAGPTFGELVRQAMSSLEGGYDQLASKFDASVFRTPDAVLDGLQTQFFECESALDIGCGTGAVLQRLQPFVKNLSGIDLSRNMLRRARPQTGPQVRLWHGDFLKTYWENHFDLITCVGVLGHIPPHRQSEFFERVYRSLRPGGCFLTVTGDLRGRPWIYLPALAFDAAMRLRNLLWSPPFVMYYLSFVLPGARHVLEKNGLICQVMPGGFAVPFSQLQIVLARKPG